jgi:hypothetical protein
MAIDETVRLRSRACCASSLNSFVENQYANAFNPGGSCLNQKIRNRLLDLSIVARLRISPDYRRRFDFRYLLLDGPHRGLGHTLEQERDHDDANYRINNESDRAAGPPRSGIPIAALLWSGYRPSDERLLNKFFIPGNMFAVATLEKMVDLLTDLGRWEETATRASTMAGEVRTAIETYGVYNHPTYGRMYAFEVNGFSSDADSSSGKLLMDAANIPSLLAIPWLGYAASDDATYQNTRSFILSHDNPYYYEGTYAKGIGDPHDGIGGTNPHPSTRVPWHRPCHAGPHERRSRGNRTDCVL